MGQVSIRKILSVLFVALLLIAGLEWTRDQVFLLFHSLTEIFSIVIAFAIFLLAWNSQGFVRNYYLLWVGTAYLFAAGLDVVHLLVFGGMSVIPGLTSDPPTQLWVSARFLQAVSLVLAPLFIRRKPSAVLTFAGFWAYVILVLLAIFRWHIFPVCYLPGDVPHHLTPFKIGMEYVICTLFLAAIGLLYRQREHFDPRVLRWLTASLLTTIVAELCFTLYTHSQALPNALGHYFKILAFYFIYKALVEIGFRKPYGLILRELKQSEDRLRELNESLERRVKERTAEVESRVNQLRSLALELTQVEQRERRRLAELLHDHLQQLLVAARLRLQLARERATPEEARAELEQADGYLAEAIHTSRTLTAELSPPVLYEGGLGAALRWLVQQMGEKQALEVSLEVEPGSEPAAEQDREFLFSAARELLFNVAKHAGTPRVWVHLGREDRTVELSVRDDGAGLDVSRLASGSGAEAGFGLFSLRERLEALGGRLTIESAPGQGTRVALSLPEAEAVREDSAVS